MYYTYPPDTKAFLYYYRSPERPRIAGELRLRVASGDDFASFESGTDLLRPNGQLWFRPLYALPKHYPPLYKKLSEDGLFQTTWIKLCRLFSRQRVNITRATSIR